MKTKALISFAVTAKLICVFVFAYAKRLFSHDAAHFLGNLRYLVLLFINFYAIESWEVREKMVVIGCWQIKHKNKHWQGSFGTLPRVYFAVVSFKTRLPFAKRLQNFKNVVCKSDYFLWFNPELQTFIQETIFAQPWNQHYKYSQHPSCKCKRTPTKCYQYDY